MILNKKATSIAEAIVVMLVVVSWVTWMYNIYNKSIQLATWTEYKIKAIQIAKQWIESFTNIRDTNWLIYSSDYGNCWNSLNYNPWCIWTSNNKIATWKYIIYKNSNNRWDLASKTNSTFWNWNYNSDFRVWIDSNWIFTQSWWTNIVPLYTREINVVNSSSTWITIKSLVQWVDNSSSQVRKVELEQVLTNRKK